MKRHEVTINDLREYEAQCILASSANERGSKRLTMFTNPVSKEVRFEVSSGGTTLKRVSIDPALAAYNDINV